SVERLTPTGSIWFLIPERWADQIGSMLSELLPRRNRVIWRETFGQYREDRFPPGHRHLLWHVMDAENSPFYTNDIRVESQRMKDGDRRAKGPRVPDDVWEFPRLVGNAGERIKGHPCQLPEVLLERIIRCSTQPGDVVLDPTAGTGTTLRVAQRLGRSYVGIEEQETFLSLIHGRLEHGELHRAVGTANAPVLLPGPQHLDRPSPDRIGNEGGLFGLRPVTAAAVAAAGDLDPGLSVRYYRAFFRLIEEFDEWMADDEGEAGAPLPALDYRVAGGAVLTGGVEDGVGAKITGLIRLDKPGTYSLLVQSNDGFILDIGGVPVLEDPDVHGDRYSKIAKLTVEQPGWYALYLLYFERKGTATLELYWKQPGDEAGAMALVPAEAFAHLEAD
ncbi:MAG: hypothetical protein IH805_06530, partial [Proteobacteria bacterium]|nr:hypothetical protein [Pseudomonadota bacterium]